MKTENKYIAVGITVLVALGLLVTMIFIFAGAPQWFTGGRTLLIYADQTHNLNSGSRVYLRGMKIGSVRKVRFTDDDPARGVTIAATIDSDILLPKKLRAQLVKQGFTGISSISIWPDSDCTDYYAADQTVVIHSITSQANSLLPPELTQAMGNFSKLADTLNNMLAPSQGAPATGPASTQPAEPAQGLNGTIARLNRTLDSIYKITGDEKNQQNLSTSLENFSKASAELNVVLGEARKLMGSSQQLSRELITDAEDISRLLKSFQKTVDALNDTKGSAGKFINDPQLYDSMDQATVELKKLILDLQHLAEKWRKEGMPIKLK